MDSIVVTFGKTRSGSPITNQFVRNIHLFSSQEIIDAYALFNYLSIREKRKRGQTTAYDIFASYFDACEKELERRKVFNDMLDLLGLKTIFDVIRFGRNLALIEFRDF